MARTYRLSLMVNATLYRCFAAVRSRTTVAFRSAVKTRQRALSDRIAAANLRARSTATLNFLQLRGVIRRFAKSRAND